ncbi:hypothetical protein BX666DRAFT_1867968 [Dichotomocladium elegans]|nr:hypothetical protein BX666DRAFT_1867968 [Dichotomocladium elegans]
MTSFGTQVKDGQIKEVTTAAGPDEYIVFIYDRQYLTAPEEQVIQLVDQETPNLEPKIPPFDASMAQETMNCAKEMRKEDLLKTCQLYMSLFASFDVQSQRLMKAIASHTQLAQRMVDEQKFQTMALNVAMTNLESHSHIARKSIHSFCAFSQKELDKQSALAGAADTNIDILRSIRVHPAILQAIGETAVERRIVDYIDVDRIESVKNKAQELCKSLEGELQELLSLASDLKQYERDLQQQISDDQDPQALDASISDIQEIQKKSLYLHNRIKRDLGRVHAKISELVNIPITSLTSQFSDAGVAPNSQARKTFEAFDHLTEIHINDYLPKLASYELDIRVKVAELIWGKRRSIERFLENMSFVSGLQSEIAAVAPRVETANKWIADFKLTEGLRDLEVVQEVLFAYGYLLIEVARRREYATVLLHSSSTFADLLTGYRSEEQKRRDTFTHTIIKMLPFRVPAVEDDAAPQCDVSTTIIQENQLDIKRKDIIDFIRVLGQHYTAAFQSGVTSPRLQGRLSLHKTFTTDRFIEMLHAMSQQLDGLRDDFFKALESTCIVHFI